MQWAPPVKIVSQKLTRHVVMFGSGGGGVGWVCGWWVGGGGIFHGLKKFCQCRLQIKKMSLVKDFI